MQLTCDYTSTPSRLLKFSWLIPSQTIPYHSWTTMELCQSVRYHSFTTTKSYTSTRLLRPPRPSALHSVLSKSYYFYITIFLYEQDEGPVFSCPHKLLLSNSTTSTHNTTPLNTSLMKHVKKILQTWYKHSPNRSAYIDNCQSIWSLTPHASKRGMHP